MQPHGQLYFRRDRKMKKTLLLLAALSGCTQMPHIPPANIAYTSVSREHDNLLRLRFSAAIQLTQALKIYDNANQLPPRLVCSLDNDPDFSVNHVIQHSAEGTVEQVDDTAPSTGFNFVAIMHLTRHGDGLPSPAVQQPTAGDGLTSRNNIACKVIIYTYGFKPYYSNAMTVPLDDWTQALNTPLIYPK